MFLFQSSSSRTLLIAAFSIVLSACGGGGGASQSQPPVAVLQDSNNILSSAGIQSMDELEKKVAEKGTLSFTSELTAANPDLPVEQVVHLLKQNNRNIEYQKIADKGVSDTVIEGLKQLPMSPVSVKKLVSLPDSKNFPLQNINAQALELFNAEKLQALNRKLRLSGQAVLTSNQFQALQSALAEVDIVDNFGALDRQFQNVLVDDKSASRAARSANNPSPTGLMLANAEPEIAPDSVFDGVPTADSCYLIDPQFPLQITSTQTLQDTALVTTDGSDVVVKIPFSGIAVFAFSSTTAAHVTLQNAQAATLVDQDISGTSYLHLPVTQTDTCQPFRFVGAAQAMDIRLIDIIRPQRMGEHVFYDGDDYLTNGYSEALRNGNAFFHARSYSFTTFDSSLSAVDIVFKMMTGADTPQDSGFDLLLHAPSGQLFAVTQSSEEGYHAAAFTSAIARESGLWRLDLLPPASVQVDSNSIATLKAVAANNASGSLNVMTLVSDDSTQIRTREFMLGVVKNISLKTQGDNGADNEGEVSIALNSSMAPKLDIPQYIDDMLANGDKMNDEVALWQCWKKSAKAGDEFLPGGSCNEYADEYQRQFDLYVYAKNNRYDPQNNPEYYQCAPGQEPDVVINGQDHCIYGYHAPWGVDNPTEDFKVKAVMNAYSRRMEHDYADANYLYILSNYYDLYQNWQSRSILMDSASFPYDGFAYKTLEEAPCLPGDVQCVADALAGKYARIPVIIQTDRPVFGAPLDRVNESTLPFTFDYAASDQDEYDTDAELWSVVSYAANQAFNLATGNFVSLVCDSINLVDDLHQLELDAEADPLGSARATINRYSSSDAFYGLDTADSYSFLMSGLAEQNNEIDTFGQKLNYAQIACGAAQLAKTGWNFSQNADYLLSLDSEQLGDHASLVTRVREGAIVADSTDMLIEAEAIASLIEQGDIAGAREKLKLNNNIANLTDGTDIFADLDSLMSHYSSAGSARNGNNVLKSNAHYLLGEGRKTRASVEFERVSSVPVQQVSVNLDRVKIIYNQESSSDSSGAEIRLLPFVGMIDDRNRGGANTRALFARSDDSADARWSRLRFNHVANGDVLTPDMTIFSASGSANAAALYIELAVMEDDGMSVEDDDMVGVFSKTIKFEELFNQNAEFKWQALGGNEYELKIDEYPIYDAKNQLSLENPLSDDYARQRQHNRNRHPSALVSFTIRMTLGDFSSQWPAVDTSLNVEVNSDKDALSMEMNEVNSIDTGMVRANIYDVFDGAAIVEPTAASREGVAGSVYRYNVESYAMQKLFDYDVEQFSGDLLPINESLTAQKNFAFPVGSSQPRPKALSLIRLLSNNRMLFVISHDSGAKIMLLSYSDSGVMTLLNSVDVMDEYNQPVYALLQARLSPDRNGLLIPYLNENYFASDRTQPAHPGLLYYRLDGDSISFQSVLVGSTADSLVDVSFIDNDNLALLTNRLLFVDDNSNVQDFLYPEQSDFQRNSCTAAAMNCLFEVLDRNIMLYKINADNGYNMDLIDSFAHVVPAYEYAYGKLRNAYSTLSSRFINDKALLKIKTLSATAGNAVIGAGRTLYNLWYDMNLGSFVKTGEGYLGWNNRLRFNPVGLYYCAEGLSCSGYLEASNKGDRFDANTYISPQSIRNFEFADFNRDLVLGIADPYQQPRLALFNLYGGAAYKGPQISGAIFDSEIKMDGSDDVPGLAFYFRVDDRDTRMDQLDISVTAQDSPFDQVIKAPFKTHNPLYTASCSTIETGVDYNCSGTIIPAYENASFKQTITISASDGIYTSQKSFTLFVDREAPALADVAHTVNLATPDSYQPVSLLFDSATSASAADCAGVDYCYLVNNGFVDAWSASNLPAWLSCSEQTASAFGTQLLRCSGQPPMGAAGQYQVQISAFQNKGSAFEKSASMLLTLDVLAPDTVPDGFSFATQSGVARDTLIESNIITLHGLTGYASLSLDKGEYRRNGGAWTNAAASDVVNGETLQLRLRSSASYSSATTATLTVGGVSASFTLNTLADPNANDATPDAFSFITLIDQARSRVVESNAITVSGITIPADISISNGEYRIDGGNWTAQSGQVSNGQSVTLRHTTASDYVSSVVSTLTIGGVSAEFRSTTQALLAPVLSSGRPIAEPVVNSLFDFTPLNMGGEVASWSIANKPVWATFDSSTGHLYGTVDSTASFTIEITASNAAGSDTLTATVNVQPDQAPYINGYATNCSIDDDVCDFSFTDNANWRSAVTQVTIGEPYGGSAITLNSPDDYELSAGLLRLKINASNNMVKQGGNWQVIISATGYSDTSSEFMLDGGTATVGTLSVSPAFAVGQVSSVTAAVTNRFGLPYQYASVDVALSVKNLTHDIDEVYRSADNLNAQWSPLSSKTVMSDSSGKLLIPIKLPGCISAGDGFQLTVGSQVLSYLNSAADCIDVDWAMRKREIFDADSGIAIDSLGNSYVLYTTNQDFEGNVHTDSGGYYDLYLVKFDRNGEQKWVRQLAHFFLYQASMTVVADMQIVNDEIYLAGTTNIDIDGAGSEVAQGMNDMFVSKLDSAGNILWTRQFGSANMDSVIHMAIHNDVIYLLSKVNFSTGDSTVPDNTVMISIGLDGNNRQTIMDSTSGQDLIWNITSAPQFMRIDASGNFYLEMDRQISKYDASGMMLETSITFPSTVLDMVLTADSVCLSTNYVESSGSYLTHAEITCLNNADLYQRWSKIINSNAPYTHKSNYNARLAAKDGVIYALVSSEAEIYYDSSLTQTPNETVNLIALNENDGNELNHRSWPSETRSDAMALGNDLSIDANANLYMNVSAIHFFNGTFQVGYIQLSSSVTYPQNGLLMKTRLAAGSTPITSSGMTRGEYSAIVTDHDHALQWDDGYAAADNSGNWASASSSCAGLTMGGYNDWRLPTDTELLRGLPFTPQENTIFQHINTVDWNVYYWTSTAVNTSSHVAVRPQGPLGDGFPDTDTVNYRCVRDL